MCRRPNSRSGRDGYGGEIHRRTLPLGEYVLSISKKGFEPHRQTVTLSGADAFVRVALTIARQQYSITVDGGSSQMDTASAAHQDAFTLDQKTFSDLPVKDGDILSALSSFVNPAGGAAATIIVDGMERTDADLPLSSIQQVRINNNAYSAEFPKPGKGRIEIDTRGGDDAFHGGLIIRARNSIFDARNPLANEKLPFSRDGYEANISGPIVKKKLWFFLDANYETQQQSQPVLRLSAFRHSSDRRALAGHAQIVSWGGSTGSRQNRTGSASNTNCISTRLRTAASAASHCRILPPTFSTTTTASRSPTNMSSRPKL